MNRITHVLLFLVFFWVHLAAYASPLRFGPEFIFSTDELMKIIRDSSWKGEKEHSAARTLASRFKSLCPRLGCIVKNTKGKWGKEWKVQFFRDGRPDFFFQISWDPRVVEVLMNPMTIEEMKARSALIEKILFGTAKELGLTPRYNKAGHVNMGAEEAFRNDPELFLRFYVDHANHPELDLGILGFSPSNAPPLSVLTAAQRQQLQLIVQEFHQGLYKTYEEIATQIQRRVHTFSTKSYAPYEAAHYQSLGLKSIAGLFMNFGPMVAPPAKKKNRRVEFRAVYGQQNYEQFIRFAELKEKRLAYLKEKKGQPILYNPNVRGHFEPQELVNLFSDYLKEMRLEYADFEMLITPKVRIYKPHLGVRCQSLFLNL